MNTRLFLILIVFSAQTVFGQVGIGTTSPSASLDIQSSNQAAPINTDGILIPKIDNFPASNPGANQDGMLVYASGSGTPSKGFYYWDNATTSWVFLVEKNYGDANYLGVNPTGLEAINEGNGIGWRLIGRNPANYGNIGLQAVDLSVSQVSSTTRGATGNYSMAIGQNTTASGPLSFASGNGSTASGWYSTAFGTSTASGWYSTAFGTSTASGLYSTASGNASTASGLYSTAMGALTKSNAYSSVALGFNNVGGGNPTAWVATDPIFEIGIGNGGSPANALTVLKNGNISAPSFTIAGINATGNKALITKEYADTNYLNSGLEAIDEGNGIGWRLIGSNPANHGNIGRGAVDMSQNTLASSTRGATNNYAKAFGLLSTASGLSSVALGQSSIASGQTSVAIGSASTASGSGSVSLGTNSNASGNYSMTQGFLTTASGIESTAMGYSTNATGRTALSQGMYTNANAYNSVALGHRNVGGGNPTTWVATDPIFEIGIGNGGSPANALTVLKNGKVGIGTPTPGTVITNSMLDVINGHIVVSNNYGVLSYNAANNGVGAGFDTTGTDDLNLYAGGANRMNVFANGQVDIPSTTDASGAVGTGALEIGNSLRLDTNEIITNTNTGLYLQNDNNGDLFVDNTTFMVDASADRVGIGTTTPEYALHVASGNSWGIGQSPSYYLHPTAGHGGPGASWSYSIVASTGRIYAFGGFGTGSDSRIKDIKGISDSKDDLEKLLNIEITNYTYKDSIEKGNLVTKKVIAQQVKQVLPNAITLTKEFIPNIYTLVKASAVNDKTLQLTFKEAPDLMPNDKVKLIPKDKAEIQATVNRVDNNIVTLKVADSDLGDKVFVYGKQVADFHTVDYDAISMLNVSATQEQQRLIVKQQEEINLLKFKIEQLEAINSRLDSIEAKLNKTNQ